MVRAEYSPEVAVLNKRPEWTFQGKANDDVGSDRPQGKKCGCRAV